MKKIIILGLFGIVFIVSAVINFKLWGDVKMWREKVIPRQTANAQKFIKEFKKKQKIRVNGGEIQGKFLKYDLENNFVEIFSPEIGDKIVVAFDEHTSFSVKIMEEGQLEQISSEDNEEVPEVPIEAVKDFDVNLAQPLEMEISFFEVNYFSVPLAITATFVIYINRE